jgi:ATP-dependent helicase/nuclease subunit B
VLDLAYLGAIDQQCADKSDVVNVRLKKDGSLGWKGTSDAAESGEFAALMKHVAWRIGQLADEIVAGRIDIAPFRLNDLTPCPRCDFRSVCRFELPVNGYHHLTVLGREQVLAQITGEGGDGA